LTGGAVTALESVVLDKGGLQRMKGVWGAQTLDGQDVIVVMHYSEGQARVDATVIHQNRTRTALSMIAALLGAREVKMLAQCIKK
jgi:hypothetical protein